MVEEVAHRDGLFAGLSEPLPVAGDRGIQREPPLLHQAKQQRGGHPFAAAGDVAQISPPPPLATPAVGEAPPEVHHEVAFDLHGQGRPQLSVPAEQLLEGIADRLEARRDPPPSAHRHSMPAGTAASGLDTGSGVVDTTSSPGIVCTTGTERAGSGVGSEIEATRQPTRSEGSSGRL